MPTTSSTRSSIHQPNPHSTTTTTINNSTSTSTTSSSSSNKTRKLTHLQAQLAQLSANLSDLENLIGITSVQGEHMAFLGGYVTSLFMSSSRVLGEEIIASSSAAAAAAAAAAATAGGKENVNVNVVESGDEGLSGGGGG